MSKRPQAGPAPAPGRERGKAVVAAQGEREEKPTSAKDIRCTGVLEKRDGRRIAVQMHGSVAADQAGDGPAQDQAEE